MSKKFHSNSRNKLFMLVWPLAAIAFVLILLSACRNMFKESLIASLLILPLLAALFFLARKNYKKITDQKLKIAQIILHIFSLALMIIVAIFGATEISWDWGALVKVASSITIENTNVYPEYFLQYPNNQFWLSFLTIFFTSCQQVFHVATEDGLKITSIILSIILFRITFIFLFLSAKEVFGARRARILDIASLFFIPFYLYAPFAYSDTPALLLVSILIYLYLRTKSQNISLKDPLFWRYALAFALIIALLYHIKILTLIIPIAMLASEIINRRTTLKNISIKYGTIIISAAILIFLLGLPVSRIIKLDTSKSDQYKFPASHWVMMSFNKTSTYNDRDVEFTESFHSYKEKQGATKKELNQRLSGMGFIGIIQHIFNAKLPTQWGNSLLLGDDIISRRSLHPDSFIERFFGIKQFGNDADYHWICLIFSWLYYIPLLLGCLLSLIQSFRLKHLHFCQIAILGAFLFFLIWECSSRYLIDFIPVIFLCSALGWFYLKDRLSVNPHLHFTLDPPTLL